MITWKEVAEHCFKSLSWDSHEIAGKEIKDFVGQATFRITGFCLHLSEIYSHTSMILVLNTRKDRKT
jgi:hypothetical protein